MAPAAANIQSIWANQKGGVGSAGFAFFVNTFNTADQKVDLSTGNGVNGDESTTASGTVGFGQWHLVSASVNRTNGTADFFVDGINIQSSSAIIKDFENQTDLNLA